MSAYPIIVLCAQAFLAHVVFSQCASPALVASPNTALESNGLGYGAGLAYGAGLEGSSLGYGSPALSAGLNSGLGCSSLEYGGPGLNGIEVTPTSGGAFLVTSFSPIAPTGLTVASQNVIEGNVAVSGELPFLGAIALDGAFPSAGAGVVDYSCGNGVTAITSEGISAGAGLAVVPAAGLGLGVASPAGLGLGVASPAGLGLLGARGCGCRGF